MATAKELERDKNFLDVKQKLKNIDIVEGVLTVAGSLYLFRNIDNIMVLYAKKPNIKAALSYDGWKDFNRHVMRGRSGIFTFGGETALGSNALFFYDIIDTAVLDGAEDGFNDLFYEKNSMSIKEIKSLYSDRINDILNLQGEISNTFKQFVNAASSYAVYKKLGLDVSAEQEVLGSMVRESDIETIYHALQVSQQINSTLLTNAAKEIQQSKERKDDLYENRDDSRVTGSRDGELNGMESVRGFSRRTAITESNETSGSESIVQAERGAGSVLSGIGSGRGDSQRGTAGVDDAASRQIRNVMDSDDGGLLWRESVSEGRFINDSDRKVSVSEFRDKSEVYPESGMGDVRAAEGRADERTSDMVESGRASGQYGIHKTLQSNRESDRRTNLGRTDSAEQGISGQSNAGIDSIQNREETQVSSYFDVPKSYIIKFIKDIFEQSAPEGSKWAGIGYVIRDIFYNSTDVSERAKGLGVQVDNNNRITSLYSKAAPGQATCYLGGEVNPKGVTISWRKDWCNNQSKLSFVEICDYIQELIDNNDFYPAYDEEKVFYHQVEEYEKSDEFKALTRSFDLFHEVFVNNRDISMLSYDETMYKMMVVFVHTHHLGIGLPGNKEFKEYIAVNYNDVYEQMSPVLIYAMEKYMDAKFLSEKRNYVLSDKGYNFDLTASNCAYSSYQTSYGKYDRELSKKIDEKLAEVVKRSTTYAAVKEKAEPKTVGIEISDDIFAEVPEPTVPEYKFIEGDEFVIDGKILEVFEIGDDGKVTLFDRQDDEDMKEYVYSYEEVAKAFSEYQEDLKANGADVTLPISQAAEYEQMDMFAMLGIDNEPKKKTSVPASAPYKFDSNLGSYLNPYKRDSVPIEYAVQILKRGTGFEGGKYRVTKLFLDNNLTRDERIRKIKAEYGTGGAGWPIDKFGLHGYDTYKGKGITARWRDKDGENEAVVGWKDIEKMIGELIARNEYFPEFAEVDAFEKEKKEYEKSEQFEQIKECCKSISNYMKEDSDERYFNQIKPYGSKIIGTSMYFAMNSWAVGKNYSDYLKVLASYYNDHTKAEQRVLDRSINYSWFYGIKQEIIDDKLILLFSDLNSMDASIEKPEVIVEPEKHEVEFADEISAKVEDEQLNNYIASNTIDRLTPFDKDNIKTAILQHSYTGYKYSQAFLVHVCRNKELSGDQKCDLVSRLIRIGKDEQDFSLYYKTKMLKIKAEHDCMHLCYNETFSYDVSYEELVSWMNYSIGYTGTEKYCSNQDMDLFLLNLESSDVELYKDYASLLAEKERINTDKNVPEVDYRYNREVFADSLDGAGLKTRYGWNVSAIRTLKKIESEKRNAKPEEQEILAKYCGWGGLFKAFDSNDAAWQKEYRELKELLTVEEYKSARSTVNDAFYTEPGVAAALGNIIRSCGFREGNLLEPALGIGHIVGNLPEDITARKFGVEIDDISGRIAKLLYPSMSIAIEGYQETNFSDGFFDCAIGNVPFGNYRPYDSKYNKHNFKIHDYFFAKTLDQVRAGGIIAFITSCGTLDKNNSTIRKYIGERAELLGAIRLPNTAFKQLAGTEVATDIIVLRKRDVPIVKDEVWFHLGYTEDNVPVNEYFLEHPECCLGKMVYENGRFGDEGKYTTCIPDGQDYKAALFDLIPAMFHSDMYKPMNRDVNENIDTIPALPSVMNHTYSLINNKVYYRNDSIMEEICLSSTNINRIKAFIALNEIARKVIDMQYEGCSDEDLQDVQKTLNNRYEEFVKEYGNILDAGNEKVLRSDDNYSFLCSLEEIAEDGTIKKADIFTRRTINPVREIVSTETAFEALRVSLAEHGEVDIRYMLDLYEPDLQNVNTQNMDEKALYEAKREELFKELNHVIYLDPVEYDKDNLDIGWKTADEYLSGNVRVKAKQAMEMSDDEKMGARFADNAMVLEGIIPEDIPYTDIDVKLGSSWIEPEDYADFMFEIFNISTFDRNTFRWIRSGSDITKYVGVILNPLTMEYRVTGQSRCKYNSYCNSVYGTKKANAAMILERTLNFKQVTVYVPGTQSKEVDREETMLAREMQEKIKMEFKNWFWKDEERREKYVRKYNDMFNSQKLREYDGSFLEFKGMNKNIELKDHQKNAVARILLGGNTLLAHCVGAGKSFEMIAAIMEQKRLGLSNKPLLIVPKSIVSQMEAEFLRLYPSANILAVKDKDFEKKNRQKFVARIATGEYDCVIMSHSQFEMIPLTKEREIYYKQLELDELTEYLAQLKTSKGDNWSIKRIEDAVKKRNEEMGKLLDTPRDNTISFEQLGVDSLFVDEAHNFKNMAIFSKINNVAGIPTASSKKAFDMRLKCRYINEISGGKGLVFATGTPVSNTMAEMYVMQAFLQPERLEELGINAFDAWIGSFGEIQASLELKVAGNGYKVKHRVKNFQNVPELMTVFKEVADIQTADMLNLPVPKIRNGGPIVVECEMDETQNEILEMLIERADALERGGVDPSEDNMLKLTNEAKQLGTDARLLNPDAPSNPQGKLFKCAEMIYKEYEQSNKDGKIGCQLVFSDMGTPKQDGTFDIYNTVKQHLIDFGIPGEEIAFIHDAKNDAQKDLLFKKTRTGQVKVLFGSTDKCGTGVNVQTHLVAMHHIDCPWKPSAIEQRNGRGVRQGNENEEIAIYHYITKGSFDAYSWSLVENKQKFISQIMTSKPVGRTCEDIDEAALNYGVFKAVATGDDTIREKMELENDLTRLRMLKSGYNRIHQENETKVNRTLPLEIAKSRDKIGIYLQELAYQQSAPVPLNEEGEPIFKMKILGTEYFTHKDAGLALNQAIAHLKVNEQVEVGEYNGYNITVALQPKNLTGEVGEKTLMLKRIDGKVSHEVLIGLSTIGNIIKINNLYNSFDKCLEKEKMYLEKLETDLEVAKQELTKGFPHEDEMRQKEQRLKEIDEIMTSADVDVFDESFDSDEIAETKRELGFKDSSNDTFNESYDEDGDKSWGSGHSL